MSGRFYHNLKRLREYHGWTMDQLAARSGIDALRLEDLELRYAAPLVEECHRLANTFGVHVRTMVFDLQAPRR